MTKNDFPEVAGISKQEWSQIIVRSGLFPVTGCWGEMLYGSLGIGTVAEQRQIHKIQQTLNDWEELFDLSLAKPFGFKIVFKDVFLSFVNDAIIEWRGFRTSASDPSAGCPSIFQFQI